MSTLLFRLPGRLHPGEVFCPIEFAQYETPRTTGMYLRAGPEVKQIPAVPLLLSWPPGALLQKLADCRWQVLLPSPVGGVIA